MCLKFLAVAILSFKIVVSCVCARTRTNVNGVFVFCLEFKCLKGQVFVIAAAFRSTLAVA